MGDETAPTTPAQHSADPARTTGPDADGPAPAAPPAGTAVPEPYLTELAPGVHAFIQPDGGWCLNNAGFVTDGDATLVVDTAATERRARLLRRRIAESGAPAPRTLVNTHHHGDHTYGNAVFAPEATVLGHASCRRELLAAGHQLHAVWPEVEYGDIRLTAPEVTYTDELTLHTGDIEVRLLHPGVAHTTGDTLVWLPRQRLVYAGDLVFHGGTPFILMGSLTGSLRALELLRSLDAVTVVPGHGPVTGPRCTTASSAICGSSAGWRRRAGRPAVRRWRWPGRRISGRSPSWPRASGWWPICTGRMRSWRARRRAHRSIRSPPSAI